VLLTSFSADGKLQHRIVQASIASGESSMFTVDSLLVKSCVSFSVVRLYSYDTYTANDVGLDTVGSSK
jgi:hypothetical protein